MPSEHLKGLFEALDDFKKNVGEFQQGRVIDLANEQVDAIRSSAESESKKRVALQDIANNLVSQLAANGTPATTIQAVTKAMAPQQFSSPEDAALEGSLQGNQDLVDKAVAADRAIRDPREQAQFKRDMIRAGAQEKALDARTKKEMSRLDTGSRDEISAGNFVIESINSLENRIRAITAPERLAVRFGAARAKQELAKLKTEAEALVVDVARAKERGVLSDSDLKRYKDMVGSITDLKSTESVLGSWSGIRDNAAKKLQARFGALEDEGKDVSNQKKRLELALRGRSSEVGMQMQAASSPNIPPEMPKGTVSLGQTKVNGRLVTKYKLPSGKIVVPRE